MIDEIGRLGAIPTTAMRGTDNAALAADWTAALATILGNFSAARIGYLDELAAANLPTDIAAIPTVMVGTNSAALAANWTAGLATILGNFSAARIGYLDELAAANLPTDVDAVKAKTDLLNSASGTSTLNDANVSDTIVPSSLPTKMHVIFDISTIIVAADDFTLEVKVGAAASERVVAYYKITSDGSDTTIDKGSGTGAVVKQRRIDISDIMVYTGEQVLLNYTKSSVTDRNVLYRYVCGV
ncbi:hypothetical protein KAW18_08120 [candidate division WOR-3 bacterium]|nr:hypothetical protein [candidate division WOR-3 bacterium]